MRCREGIFSLLSFEEAVNKMPAILALYHLIIILSTCRSVSSLCFNKAKKFIDTRFGKVIEIGGRSCFSSYKFYAFLSNCSIVFFAAARRPLNLSHGGDFRAFDCYILFSFHVNIFIHIMPSFFSAIQSQHLFLNQQ